MLKFYIAGAVIIAAIGAIWFFGLPATVGEPEPVVQQEQNEPLDADIPPPVPQVPQLVTVTDDGYSPSELSVSTGDVVIFRNQSTRAVWVATAVHPTHTVYPGSGITKCNAGEAIFDSCLGVAPGDDWSFQFNEAGEWGYHNHLRPSQTGKIIVE